MSASASSTPLELHRLVCTQLLIHLCLMAYPGQAVDAQIKTKEWHTTLFSWSYGLQERQIEVRNIHHTAPVYAIVMLKALVLFSVLSLDLSPFKMPTMIARMITSPAEQTAKDMFEIRLRARESNSACSCILGNVLLGSLLKQAERTYVLFPSFAFSRDSLTSGRSCASPGKAAPQKVCAP